MTSSLKPNGFGLILISLYAPFAVTAFFWYESVRRNCTVAVLHRCCA